jgi:threonine/homoserine/homoserine lactone efflux protein
MIPTESFLLFLTTCLIIELTPGPNMGYLAVLSLTAGRRAGFTTVASIATGLLVIGMLAALGAATLISASPLALLIIHACGVAYMFWLAWQSWHEEAELSPGKAADGLSGARYFRRGLITNILNPKALVFYIAVLPGFVARSGDVMPQTILLTLISVTIATLVHGAIVLLAARLQAYITQPAQRARVRKISALLLAAIAVWLAVSGPN